MSRWYPETLKKRILDIARIKKGIRFIRGDGFEVIRKNARDSRAVFFIDPPYTASSKKAGTRLYKYHQVDHEELFRLADRIQGDFLMTYDDAEEVRALAVKHRLETRLAAMSSTHHATMNELLVGRNLFEFRLKSNEGGSRCRPTAQWWTIGLCLTPLLPPPRTLTN